MRKPRGNYGLCQDRHADFRIEPELKESVRVASVNEHRSIANMIAVMIRDYCGRVWVEIVEPVTATKKPRRK